MIWNMHSYFTFKYVSHPAQPLWCKIFDWVSWFLSTEKFVFFLATFAPFACSLLPRWFFLLFSPLFICASPLWMGFNTMQKKMNRLENHFGSHEIKSIDHCLVSMTRESSNTTTSSSFFLENSHQIARFGIFWRCFSAPIQLREPQRKSERHIAAPEPNVHCKSFGLKLVRLQCSFRSVHA